MIPHLGRETLGDFERASRLEWLQTNGLGGYACGSVALAPFGSPANVALGAFGVNSQVAAITPASGFTEIDELPANEGTRGDLQTEWAVNQPTVGASWPFLKGGALGIELKASSGP